MKDKIYEWFDYDVDDSGNKHHQVGDISEKGKQSLTVTTSLGFLIIFLVLVFVI